MRMILGIHQLKVPLPMAGLPYVLPYLVQDGDENLLIDCGWNDPESYRALSGQLEELGTPINEVRQLALTHVHPDHYGLAGRVKQESGATVVMHERERTLIVSRYRDPLDLLQEMDGYLHKNGVPEDEVAAMRDSSLPFLRHVVASEPDTTLQGGEHLQVGRFVLEALWTPGHSPGHLCFYEPNHKLLLTGDHILPTITPNVSLHPQQTGNPLSDYLASLKKLYDLPVDRVLPAHEFDVKHLRRRIDEILHHHDERLGEMEEAVGPDGTTAYQVARTIRWATGAFDSFNHWMQRAALAETLAHLVYLVSRDRLRESERDGRRVFWRP